MSEPLHFNEKEIEASLTTKPTYKVLPTYETAAKTMGSAVSLLVLKADVNFKHQSLISTYWK